jgi:hypothetical protein
VAVECHGEPLRVEGPGEFFGVIAADDVIETRLATI